MSINSSKIPYENKSIKKPEGRIVKAAIRCHEFVYTGHRHHEIRNAIKDEGVLDRESIMRIMSDEWNQGFITENAFYLTRKQALCYALMINQVQSEKIQGGTLTSEDLW